MSYKDYKITSHNSTACGYPGRNFDWSKFCWDGSEVIEYADYKTKKFEKRNAPLPYQDDGFIADGNQYLHVPYEWKEAGTIYRVRPNESMRVGKFYRGKLITKQTAVKKKDGWYWRLYFEGE